MTTKKPRINVTFEETIAGVLTGLAQLEHKSVSSLVRELTLQALELREDLYLSKLADKRDQEKANLKSHNEAWN